MSDNNYDDEDIDATCADEADEADDIHDLYGFEDPEDNEEAAYDDVLKIIERGD
ncbi:hypothetical protein [Pectobacterium odoriferum]|uniref:hypothetical protein n=1 Tax=Pectobacterium odoriferum TaxID=78398 RepID=UPI000AD0D706|nr:hypothetical protein [Pectobacterium odoriferum]